MRSIGIDLGTTNSSVAAYDPETLNARVITDEYGRTVIPSVVSFDPRSNTVLVGWPAKGNLVLNPASSIVDVKRELGKTFADVGPMDVPNSEPDEWFTSKDDYRIRFAGQWLSPEEISAFILSHLKKNAEKTLGSAVRSAVIAIPAYYTQKEKQAVVRAGQLAGLDEVTMVSEPVAAVLAYAADHYIETQRTCLVFRVGGGSSDASIVRVAGTSIEVQAVDSCEKIGGASFDECIAEWATRQIKSQFESDILRNTPAWFELRIEAERAKLRLGVENSAALYLVNAIPGSPIRLEIHRAEFEELIRPLVEQLMAMVMRVLDAGGISVGNVEHVLLVGGATYVPLVRGELAELLQRPPSAFVVVPDPDTCIARGAAIRAASVASAGDAQLGPDLATADRSAAHATTVRPLEVARHRFLRLLDPETVDYNSDEFGPLPGRSPRVFLCHAAEDKPTVRDLYSRLSKNGIHPWLDEKNLLPGQDWRLEISNAMQACDAVLVCLSQTSVSKTGYVQKEIREAIEIADLHPEGAIFLIPVRLDDCTVPGKLERLHRVDLFASDGFGRLVRALRTRSEMS